MNESHDESRATPDKAQAPKAVQQEMQALDVGFIRVLEDLIDALIENGSVRLTDLPPQAQEKLNQRKRTRQRLRNSLDLIGDHDDGII